MCFDTANCNYMQIWTDWKRYYRKCAPFQIVLPTINVNVKTTCLLSEVRSCSLCIKWMRGQARVRGASRALKARRQLLWSPTAVSGTAVADLIGPWCPGVPKLYVKFRIYRLNPERRSTIFPTGTALVPLFLSKIFSFLFYYTSYQNFVLLHLHYVSTICILLLEPNVKLQIPVKHI